MKNTINRRFSENSFFSFILLKNIDMDGMRRIKRNNVGIEVVSGDKRRYNKNKKEKITYPPARKIIILFFDDMLAILH